MVTVIHRLDHKGCVKVGDFGLAEDMYGTGYVREDSKTVKIPYKWMPPESLEDALFSELSDVVRYEGDSACSFLSIAVIVVIWSDMLGDLHSWKDSISCSGPSHSAPHGEGRTSFGAS